MPCECHLWQHAQSQDSAWSPVEFIAKTLPVSSSGWDASRTPVVKSFLWARLPFLWGFCELSLTWLRRYTEILFIVPVGLNLPGHSQLELVHLIFSVTQILLQPQLVCLTSRSSKKYPLKQWFSSLTQIQNTLHILKLFQFIPFKYCRAFCHSGNTSS